MTQRKRDKKSENAIVLPQASVLIPVNLKGVGENTQA